MNFVIGTRDGLFLSESSGAPKPAPDLAGRHLRHLSRVQDGVYAGTDAGLFRSPDGGRSWRFSGLAGYMIWDLTSLPGDPLTLLAATQPAGLFRSRDGGRSWAEIESFRNVPGAERWCVPFTPPEPGCARTIALDPSDPARWWVGVEVGGALRTEDAGQTWTCLLPGGNPDIHTMAFHPGRGVLLATTGYGRLDQSEPREQRIAGVFASEDGGKGWRYRWTGLEPRYTRPMCVDRRPPHAVTVGASPTTFSSHLDPDGARAMLYRSDDAGETWRSLGDAAHSPSSANFFSMTPDPDAAGGVLVGTDAGEVWRVTSGAVWTRLVSGLPAVQAVLPVATT